MTKAVVFDLFGTLVTWPQDFPHIRAMAARLGIDPEALRPGWHKVLRQRNSGELDTVSALSLISREMALAVSDETIRLAAGEWIPFARSVLVPRRGALETLDAIRGRGLRVGLLSDCSEEVTTVWPETSMAPFFDAAVFSCAEGSTKPDPRLYEAVTRRLGVEPAECLYVGNGDGEELAGATRAGMRAVLFTADGEYPGREAATWKGDRINDLSRVMGLIGPSA